jgi:hypothetical protein
MSVVAWPEMARTTKSCTLAARPSYQALLSHVRPAELLGLTATPERSDGLPILDWFDGRIAAELRLWDAIDQHRLVPFSYFGVHDGLDLRDVPWRRGRGYDVDTLSNLFTSNDAWGASFGRWKRPPLIAPGSVGRRFSLTCRRFRHDVTHLGRIRELPVEDVRVELHRALLAIERDLEMHDLVHIPRFSQRRVLTGRGAVPIVRMETKIRVVTGMIVVAAATAIGVGRGVS